MMHSELFIVPSDADSDLFTFSSLNDLHEHLGSLNEAGFSLKEANALLGFVVYVHVSARMHQHIERLLVKRVCFTNTKPDSASLQFLTELIAESESLSVYTMNQTEQIQRALYQYLNPPGRRIDGNFMLHFDVVEPVPGEIPYVATAIR